MENKKNKYIQIRYSDYWWSVYKCMDYPPNGVEFSVTEDEAGEEFFFHFDIYNLPALRSFIETEEFIEKSEESYDFFLSQVHELQSGDIDYFIGALHYTDYEEGIAKFNQEPWEKKIIYNMKQAEMSPYYAVVFIGEEKSLVSQLLIEWMKKLSISLFQESIVYKIANIPSYNDTIKLYQSIFKE